MTSQELYETEQLTVEARVTQYIKEGDGQIKLEPWIAKLPLAAAIAAAVNGMFAAEIEPGMMRPSFKKGGNVFMLTASAPIIAAALEACNGTILVAPESDAWAVRMTLTAHDLAAAKHRGKQVADINWGVLNVAPGVPMTKIIATNLVGNALSAVGPFFVDSTRTTMQTDSDGLATGKYTIRFRAEGNVANVDAFHDLLSIRYLDNIALSFSPSWEFCNWWQVHKDCLRPKNKCNCQAQAFKPSGKRAISSAFGNAMKKATTSRPGGGSMDTHRE